MNRSDPLRVAIAQYACTPDPATNLDTAVTYIE